MRSAIWIAYDFGVRGDYEGLYSWLDKRAARECGDSLAFISYPHAGSLLESLKKDLQASIELSKQSRIYVIYRESGSTKMKGAFLFGGRKAAPWVGHSGRTTTPDSD
jgi:hypothetical protein